MDPTCPLGAERELRRLVEIGVALSAETDLDLLLGQIVRFAREVSGAEAASLYTLEEDRLEFRVVQNERVPGVLSLPPVSLTNESVSAYAALHRTSVKVDDVYASDRFDFSGPRRYDEHTGYRSRSMLVVPLLDREGTAIGVLQLINALDPTTREVVGFGDEVVPVVEALASQAAVALANTILLVQTKTLFESLIRVLAVALDAKSPYTGDHVQRVALLNTALAQAVHNEAEGPFNGVRFSKSEMEEIRLAGWLHDVGKVTTPTWVMDKATKLEAIFDRAELVAERFGLFAEALRAQALEQRLEVLAQGAAGAELEAIEGRLAAGLAELEGDLVFVRRCNRPEEAMDEDAVRRLAAVGAKVWPTSSGERRSLTDDELRHLSVRRGTLTDEEFQVMKDHVVWTSRMLSQVPFTPALRGVLRYASQHHERLNGMGYPEGLSADAIPLQSRILAVADMYEALSSKSRPYKEALSEEAVLDILRRAAAVGEIDSDVLGLLIRRRVHETFEQEYVVSQGETSR